MSNDGDEFLYTDNKCLLNELWQSLSDTEKQNVLYTNCKFQNSVEDTNEYCKHVLTISSSSSFGDIMDGVKIMEAKMRRWLPYTDIMTILKVFESMDEMMFENYEHVIFFFFGIPFLDIYNPDASALCITLNLDVGEVKQTVQRVKQAQLPGSFTKNHPMVTFGIGIALLGTLNVCTTGLFYYMLFRKG